MTLRDRLADLIIYVSNGLTLGLLIGTITGTLAFAVPAYLTISVIFREIWNHA